MAESLNFHESGSAHGEVLVCLHGFLGSSQDWKYISEAILVETENRFRIVAVDLPGHGGSTGMTERAYTFSGVSELLLKIIDQSGRPVHLLGYSMGGRLAAAFASVSPRKITSLILVSSGIGLREDDERASRTKDDELLARRLETANFSDFLNDWYIRELFAGLRRTTHWREILACRHNNDPQELAKALRGFSQGHKTNFREVASSMSFPILYISGEADKKYSAIGAEVATLCPNARHRIIPESGHCVHDEQPLVFASTVAEFLRTFPRERL